MSEKICRCRNSCSVPFYCTEPINDYTDFLLTWFCNQLHSRYLVYYVLMLTKLFVEFFQIHCQRGIQVAEGQPVACKYLLNDAFSSTPVMVLSNLQFFNSSGFDELLHLLRAVKWQRRGLVSTNFIDAVFILF